VQAELGLYGIFMMSTKRTNLLAVALTILAAGNFLPGVSKLLTQQCGAEQESGAAQSKSKNETKKHKKVASKEEAKTMPIYEFKAKALDGTEINLDKYKGDVMLIVNTASKCGYTPQFTGLEELNKKYAAKGLKVLGFPCNQFGQQEPGNSTEIGSFCQRNYGVDFQMFEKIDVNGADAHPLYRYLTGSENGGTPAPIKWNFTKFLVDRHGNVVKRYEPATKPEELAADIEKQL
jgi:glutathione peroxidase